MTSRRKANVDDALASSDVLGLDFGAYRVRQVNSFQIGHFHSPSAKKKGQP
jgi:hypothetical protein